MENTLRIIKDGTAKFWHIHNGITLSKFSISDFECSIDGYKFNIIQNDGAARYTYLITNITLQDNTDAGVIETFTDAVVFQNRLIAIQYTPYLNFTADFLSSDEIEAIHGASSPSATNPFLTAADVDGVSPYRDDFVWTSGPQDFVLPVGVAPKFVFYNRTLLIESLGDYSVSGTTTKTVTVTYTVFDPSETNIITISN